MDPKTIVLARASLAFLWIFTGLTSVLFAPEVGYQILANAGITGLVSDAAVWLGAGADLGLGLWIISGKWQRLCYLAQLGLIALFTLLLTLIAPEFWLHPFGPVTKNLPILVLIWLLYRSNHS